MADESKSLKSGAYSQHSPYLSYLVRLWAMPGEPGDAGRDAWRASVESPMTREQHHFTDLESLFAYLRTMTEHATTDDTGDVAG